MMLRLPLREGELGLLGEEVVGGARIVTRRGENLLELQHVVALIAQRE